jgi:hypothetical protein
MSGLKFSKCLNQTSLICIFKAFGVIVLHFIKGGKIESGGHFTNKKKRSVFEGIGGAPNGSVGLPEPHLFLGGSAGGNDVTIILCNSLDLRLDI